MVYTNKLLIDQVTGLLAAAAALLQLCPTLCDPIDGSPPGLLCPWDSPKSSFTAHPFYVYNS